MSALTRRRSPDVPTRDPDHPPWRRRVGVIAERVGNPTGTPHWQWACGFYPGSHPRECTQGTAASFEEARAAFEAAWRVFLANRTEADFREWRDHQKADAEKREAATF